MELMEAVKNRRAVREYTDAAIDRALESGSDPKREM